MILCMLNPILPAMCATNFSRLPIAATMPKGKLQENEYKNVHLIYVAKKSGRIVPVNQD
jgi:hypothetical protein